MSLTTFIQKKRLGPIGIQGDMLSTSEGRECVAARMQPRVIPGPSPVENGPAPSEAGNRVLHHAKENDGRGMGRIARYARRLEEIRRCQIVRQPGTGLTKPAGVFPSFQGATETPWSDKVDF